jgi:SAM-dependent methyltransferase
VQKPKSVSSRLRARCREASEGISLKSVSRYFVHDHASLFGWIRYEPDDYLLFLMGLLRPKENELILDDGSGNGRFSIAIAEKGSNVILLDINKNILKTAKESLEQEKLADKTEAVLGDIQNLPFASSTFDRILCAHNLWYIPDYRASICEMLRTLKDEGKAVIDHLNVLNWRAFIDMLINVALRVARRNPTPIFYRTPREILHPFRGLRVEVWNLNSSGGEWSVEKGVSLWSMRLIVRYSKSLSKPTQG